MGLCVPSVCQVIDFNVFKPFLVSSINQIMPGLLIKVKGYDENKKLKTSNLVFSDSKALNEQAT
jgi:hypothetical protein